MKAKYLHQFKPTMRVPIGEFIHEALYMEHGWDEGDTHREAIEERQTQIILEMMARGFTADEISWIFIEPQPLPYRICLKLHQEGILSHMPAMIERLDKQYFTD